ncbi:hypothetical protein I4U23_005577 [Adineta vaga]|nr:hypothetical protein I4U23_005577 [Adineta vaga]
MAQSLRLLTVVILFLTVQIHSSSSDDVGCQPFKPTPLSSIHCTKPKWTRQATTVAGTTRQQESSNMQLSSPSGIFIDHYDNLFVADEGNDRIQKLSIKSKNIGFTIAGGNGRGSALNQLKEPTHVYVDSVGSLFITDRGNLRVQKWFPGGLEGATIASGRAYSNHWFQGLTGNRKHLNEIYSSESIRGNGRIMRYPVVGGIDNAPTYATLLGFVNSIPGNLVLDECNNVYVVDSANGNILKFRSGNSTGEQIASGFISPNDIALDAYGNLYIVERDTNRVQRLNVHAGTRETIAGNEDGARGNDNEHLNKPWSIAFDSHNNLYVSDKDNHRIQKFSFEEGDIYC